MSSDFELWESKDSNSMWGVPNHRRIYEIANERGSRLLLRFIGVDWEEAKRLKDRFLYDGNPDEQVPLNIPAEDFLTKQYRCGLRSGDRLFLPTDYPLIVADRAVGMWPAGTTLQVQVGDVEYPEWIYVSVMTEPKQSLPKIRKFEIHEKDVAAGLVTLIKTER